MSVYATQSGNLVAASSQYFSRVDSANLSVTGDLTLECWIKLASAPPLNNQYTIAAKYSGSTQRSWWFQYADSASTKIFTFRYTSGGTSGTQTTHSVATTLSTSTWTHVAAVFTAASHSTEFFVNAVSVGSDNGGAVTSIFDGTAPFTIGAIGDPDNQFDGRVSLVRYWAQTRTALQLSTNYCALLGSTTNLRGEWSLNNTLNDNSGNSETLTNNNVATFVTDIPGICAPNSSFLMFM